MHYHVSWLEVALENFKNNKNVVHALNSDMTLGEFIVKYAGEDLKECVEVK